MKLQFDKLGLEVERFPGLEGISTDLNPKRKTLGQIGCLKSHCAVIKDALEKEYEQILIFEDDVVLCDDFNERLVFCTKHLPADWCSLYLGGTIFAHPPVPVVPFVHRNRKTFGNFSFILKCHLFEDLIGVYSQYTLNADDCHAEYIQKKYPSYIIVPFLTHIRHDVSNVIPGEILPQSLFDRIYKYFQNKDEFTYAYPE
jgi:GR25 family glycosyltransferase involved in LPS biosynthesis